MRFGPSKTTERDEVGHLIFITTQGLYGKSQHKRPFLCNDFNGSGTQRIWLRQLQKELIQTEQPVLIPNHSIEPAHANLDDYRFLEEYRVVKGVPAPLE